METVKSRSESPFSKSKAKIQRSDTPENGDAGEQVKSKKKSQRHNKQRVNGKENGDPEKNGNDFCEDEKSMSQEVEIQEEKNNADNEECNNGYENDQEVKEVVEKEEIAFVITTVEENIIIVESNGSMHETSIPEGCEEPNMTIETESSAKKDILEQDEIIIDLQAATDNIEENLSRETNNSDSFTHNQETAEECLTETTPQTELNGSDGSSHYEDVHTTKDHIQASPDTVTKEDTSISNKISNFLGKWNYSSSQEEKDDSEISSSKKLSPEDSLLNHPYLSKVSGRRGIRDRLNSSLSFPSSKEEGLKTPPNSGNLLNDSFRVRTNPPRLNSSEIEENPTLRKYKGKRCLNASDEPEDDTGISLKRQKMDDGQDTGLLGSILWSPFRKKSLESEKLKPESKLSRFLSPFWFWKKTAAEENGK